MKELIDMKVDIIKKKDRVIKKKEDREKNGKKWKEIDRKEKKIKEKEKEDKRDRDSENRDEKREEREEKEDDEKNEDGKGLENGSEKIVDRRNDMIGRVIKEEERNELRKRWMNGWKLIEKGWRNVDGIWRRCRIEKEECEGRKVERKDSISDLWRKIKIWKIEKEKKLVEKRIDRNGKERLRCMKGGIKSDRCRKILVIGIERRRKEVRGIDRGKKLRWGDMERGKMDRVKKEKNRIEMKKENLRIGEKMNGGNKRMDKEI